MSPAADLSAPESSERFLSAVFTANQRLLTASHLPSVLPAVLAPLGEAAGANRIGVWEQVSAPKTLARLRVEWTGGVSGVASPLHYDREGLSRWLKALLAQETVSGSLTAFPEPEQAYLQQSQTAALLLIPVFVGGQLWGCLRFDRCQRDRPWTALEARCLRGVADSLAAAIAHQQTSEALAHCEARLQALSQAHSVAHQPDAAVSQTPPEPMVGEGTHMDGYHKQKSYALLEGVINSTNDLIFVKDTRGKYLLANHAMARALGLEPQDIVGKDDSQLYPPAIAQAIQKRDRQLLQLAKSQTFEQRIPVGGESRIFLASKTPYRDGTQQIIGLVGISRDITDLQQIREERDRFFRLSSDMICTVGFDGAFKRVNPSFTRLLGYSREELVSQPLVRFVHPGDQAVLQQVLVRVRAGEPFQSFENQCQCKNGDYRWFSWSVTPYPESQIFYATARDITARKLTEKALQESEQRFRDVTAAAGEYVWETSAAGIYTFLTEKVQAVKGYRSSDLLGKSLFTALPPGDVALVRQHLQQASAQRQSFHLEHRSITPQGHMVWEEMSGLPIIGSEGQVIGFRGTGLSITEQKQSEAALRVFKQAVESASDAICITDADFELTYHNAAFGKLLELQAHPEAAVFFRSGVAYGDSLIPKAIAAAIRQEQPYAGEVTLRSRWGKRVPVLLRAHAIRDEDGNIIGTVQTFTDISDRKAAQAELQMKEEFLRSIYDGTAHRIFAINVLADGRFVYSGHNRAAEEATGWSSSSVVGKTPADLFGETDGRIIEDICQRCVDSRKPTTQEEKFILGGKEAWVLTTFTPLRDRRGKVHRIVGTSFDITAIKRAEAELKQQRNTLQSTLETLKQTQAHLVQSEKMSSLGQLVAGVAHEINNPVNFIYGNLVHARQYIEDLLKLILLYRKQYPTPTPAIDEAIEIVELDFLIEDLPKLLGSMQVGTERIREIVLSLQRFSRMDESEMKVVNIHDGIDSTLMILQNRFRASPKSPEIKVIRDYGRLPLVECWAGQLNQVFMNILSNAIDALSESGPGEGSQGCITVTTQTLGGGLVSISIQDNGAGVPSPIQRRVFDPFFTTKPIGKGTGLGLAISYQIITERHRGRLTCDSDPGVGTTFTITIPTRQHRQKAPA